MKKILAVSLICICFLAAGCGNIRFAPGQIEKQNAWLHNQTTKMAADAAKEEGTSESLQKLAALSEQQSRAFVNYYGWPKEFPKANTVEEILDESNVGITEKAFEISAQRPDAFKAAGNLLDAAIGIAALLGGVYGVKAVEFLKTAKQKSEALKEIIQGNELFKKQNSDYAAAFKVAHREQSAETRQLVAAIKN